MTSGSVPSPTAEGSSSVSATATAPNIATADATAANFCRVITLNLDVLTKAASAPNDPGTEQGIKQVRELADVAPGEIRPDVRVIADFDQKVLTTLRAAGSPDAIQETPELTAALAHEARWTAAHCIH